MDDRQAVRERQAVLKARYLEDPATAQVEIEAVGVFGEDDVTTTVRTWAGDVRAGLHPGTGGDGTDACSAQMLLEALLGCAGVTMRAVSAAMRLEIHSARLTATGSFDARGTLAVSRQVPVGLDGIEVRAILDTDASDAQLARLAELTERYCVVAQSLRNRPSFVVRRA